MKNGKLESLERDVEEARRRVLGDVARLRSPETVASFKRDVSSEIRSRKDGLVAKGKEAARSRADGVVETIKAKIAANPGAALAIGAGLAWRFYRHPPVTPLLVGAGLTALLRTDPEHPQVGSDVAARAALLARSAGDRVREWPERPAAEHLRELARDTKDRVVELGSRAHEKLTGLPQSAIEAGTHGWSEIVRQGRSLGSTGSTALRDAFTTDQRDTYLLGFAAVALAAAVGMTAARSNQHADLRQRVSRSGAIRKKRSKETDGELRGADDARVGRPARQTELRSGGTITAA
jgi:hypothetical protein